MIRTVGIVERWDERGRFGFIRTSRADYFAHVDSLVDRGAPLVPGHLVEFTPAASARGPRAMRVRRLPACCPKCSAELLGLRCSACGFLLGT
jgi:cold shock CspA family protein